MTNEMREVRIGDRNIVVPRFNGYKATVAGEIVRTITERSPEIANAAAEFRIEYEKKHVERITRAEAKLERNMRPKLIVDENGDPRLTEEGRVAVQYVPIFSEADFGDLDAIEIPSSPTQPEQFAAVFPMIWDLARDEIVKLLAIITAPNAELADADEEGTVDAYLTSKGKALLHEGDLDQIVNALLVGVEVLADQFRDKPGLLGKIAAFIDQLLGTMNAEAEIPTSTEPTAKTPERESSIDSPAHTDGPEGNLSTAQVGTS